MQNKLLQFLIDVAIIAGIGILIALALLLIIFIIVSALYIAPAKQHKYNLKELARDRNETRLYLQEYQAVIENDKIRQELDLKVKQVKSLEDKIRKKAAELKSINATVEKTSKDKSNSKAKATPTTTKETKGATNVKEN